MKIILLEDDHEQASFIKKQLMVHFSGTGVEIKKSEHAFYQYIDQLNETNLPDVVVLDVMVRWIEPDKPENLVPPPDEVKKEKFYKAGFRCVEYFRNRSKTPR